MLHAHATKSSASFNAEKPVLHTYTHINMHMNTQITIFERSLLKFVKSLIYDFKSFFVFIVKKTEKENLLFLMKTKHKYIYIHIYVYIANFFSGVC